MEDFAVLEKQVLAQAKAKAFLSQFRRVPLEPKDLRLKPARQVLDLEGHCFP